MLSLWPTGDLLVFSGNFQLQGQKYRLFDSFIYSCSTILPIMVNIFCWSSKFFLVFCCNEENNLVHNSHGKQKKHHHNYYALLCILLFLYTLLKFILFYRTFSSRTIPPNMMYSDIVRLFLRLYAGMINLYRLLSCRLPLHNNFLYILLFLCSLREFILFYRIFSSRTVLPNMIYSDIVKLVFKVIYVYD